MLAISASKLFVDLSASILFYKQHLGIASAKSIDGTCLWHIHIDRKLPIVIVSNEKKWLLFKNKRNGIDCIWPWTSTFVYNKLSLFVKKDIIDRRAIENIVVQLRWFILHNKLDMRQCKNFNYDKCLTQLWSLKKTKTT